ncbi:hypothetical protein O988_04851 [Pseudogymnoascus sp. VKM F-3808]|nr:hypothetical protein O988_04851 [Pseudogymnoascus sp. VKM F-3808]
MHPRLRRNAHTTLAIWVPRHPERDGPAETAGGGDLEAEVIVKTCDRVIMLVDDKEMAAGGEMAVVEVIKGGKGERRRGKVSEIRGYL